MKSAIEKIFKGETSCQEIPVTEEWKRIAAKEQKICDEFYASLNKKQKEQFDKILELETEQQVEMELQYYKEGFKLGLMLAAESAIN